MSNQVVVVNKEALLSSPIEAGERGQLTLPINNDQALNIWVIGVSTTLSRPTIDPESDVCAVITAPSTTAIEFSKQFLPPIKTRLL